MIGRLAVGERYPGALPPQEGVLYEHSSAGHIVLSALEAPTAIEERAYKSGPCEFALVVDGSAILLLSRFGPLPWADAPYSWHLVPADRRDLPSADLDAEKRATIAITLVDLHSRLVRALRLVSVSPDFTRALHGAIRAQAAQSWSEAAYDADLARVFSSPTDALVSRAVARSVGGA